MNLITLIKNSFFRLHQRLIHTLVKTKIIGPTAQDLGLDSSKPIVYAMQYQSYGQELVVDKVVTSAGLPSTLAAHIGEQKKVINPFFSSYKRAGAPFRKRGIPLVSKRLTRWIDFIREQDEQDIQIVPVVVFWGRSPDKERSFLKIWMQSSGTLGGRLSTMFAILFNGRETAIRFSPPISLRQLINEGKDTEITARKLSRVLRVHFRQVNATVLGPDLSHRSTLVHQIPRKPLVIEAIEEEMQLKNISRKKANALALKYADEIAANMTHGAIRFLDVLLTWVWNKIYNGVNVYNIERLQNANKDNAIIYVPCHRSHIDYLLLSYVLYHNGLQVPHIAAGINLNMPIAGPILRRGGAFFMRRTFKGNKLYAAVFDEYLHSVFSNGYSTEYFVEGGRSRTGRTLNPKAGMLAMTLRSYLRDSRKPIIFMPVYVGYEKVFESNSYQGELKGKKKKKEGLGTIFSSLRNMKRSFGKVRVTFGDPINFDNLLDAEQPNWREQRSDNNFKPEWTSKVVNKLALEVATQINNAASVNPINLVATGLLATPHLAMDAQLLANQLDDYKRLLQSLPYTDLVEIPEGDGKEWITYAEKMGMVSVGKHSLGDIIQADDSQAISLSYYRNNVFHIFAMPSLLASLFVNNRGHELEEIQTLCKFLYPFFKAELFLRWELEELPEVIDIWLEALVGLGLLERQGNNFSRPAANSNEYVKLAGFAHVAMQTQERYFLTLSLLTKVGSGHINAKELEEQSSILASRISVLHGISTPEFFDKNLFRTLIEQLTAQGLLVNNEEGQLTFDDSLTAMTQELERVLDASLRQSILQITWQQ
ncbi:glycerol-3-phosphate 1-O-acyltransferase [Oleispira antarctica]|uniref:Glycerol-3-phosphate acyltransferase n=1 Tax=Oleispira antarctica TaxID=188908 RepID=A0A1Y5HU82_OLEAN|nr:glycerol-3-phosphate 1-O-acyltransferase [Oleispira antarctica]